MHEIRHLAFWAGFSLKGLELQSQVVSVIREHRVTVVSIVSAVFQIPTLLLSLSWL